MGDSHPPHPGLVAVSTGAPGLAEARLRGRSRRGRVLAWKSQDTAGRKDSNGQVRYFKRPSHGLSAVGGEVLHRRLSTQRNRGGGHASKVSCWPQLGRPAVVGRAQKMNKNKPVTLPSRP